MLHGTIVPSVNLILCFMETKSFSQQSMDEQYCTRTKSTSDHVILSTSHAPSLITCSFVCKENPDCRTFSFSSNVCTLYWKPADQTVSNPGATSPVTCSSDRKDGGKYTCTYSSTYQFCLCMSSANMILADATASCKYYNTNVLAVQNPGKNAFIKSFLNQQTSN